jgi:hypothetical protein
MKYKVLKLTREVHSIIIEADSEEEAEILADEEINSADWVFDHSSEQDIMYGDTEEVLDDNN